MEASGAAAEVTSGLRSLAVDDASSAPLPESQPVAPEAEGAKEEEDEEGWVVASSDGEGDGGEAWLPPPDAIRRLYELLGTGHAPALQRPPLPRRAPTPEPDSEEDAGSAGQPDSEEEEEAKPPVPTEFDFEDEPAPPKSALIDRRRTPGPPSRGQKREARLDKVLSDMKRHKKLEEQILRTGRDLFQLEGDDPPKTTPVPQKRPPGIFLRQRRSAPSRLVFLRAPVSLCPLDDRAALPAPIFT
ncbi:PAXIP1-associated glutamate-rich protein 1 [Cuculus canorus]|uniref:PAXIP1-associated glutamate-rich protein 1 n=1 Tax=Cuculus canorus TaxID=55661 RepID=UPI0023AA3C5F|nr:PAXIP1-associated glutamate-rich protein 1 [Cuculus canorus]